MPDPQITSSANPRIKRLVKLHTRRERDRSGEFLVEGRREVERALAAGGDISELYVAVDGNGAPWAPPSGVAATTVSADAIAKASYRRGKDVVLAVARQFSTSLQSLEVGEHPLLLIVEAIEKPGNLGTMLRTADAAGIDGLIVCDPTTDVFNPNVVRASLGTLFTVPLATAPTTEVISWLRDRAVSVAATSPAADTPYTEADLTGAVAIAVGSESHGLSEAWLSAGAGVHIPMAGSIDSLNAAASAAILLFEAVRQRQLTADG